jgi:hypothetical protein
MKKDFSITHEFVEFIPSERAERTLYVSIPYATAVHSCFCGCRTKVVTPIAPTAWQITFDGDTVSLYPSVGSWQLPCRSHYWIKRNRVIWAGDMSQEEINRGRSHDRAARDAYYGKPATTAAAPQPIASPPKKRKRGILDWMLGR